MRREPAPGRLSLVEELCNTVNRVRGRDWLADLGAAQQWADECGVHRRLREPDRDRIVAGREVLRAFLVDRTEGADPVRSGRVRAELNRLIATTLAPPQVDADGRLTLTAARSDAATVLLAPALAGLLSDGLSGDGRRLRACAAPECRWIFYDRSRPRTGQWCDMDVCGARHKMRRYRGAD